MSAVEELAELKRALKAGEASDGQHTHAELYTFRLLYNAHAARMWAACGVPVVKSWRHHDGAECFDGDYFIVVVTLAEGQVSNHYPASAWDLFTVPAVATAPEHDGHSAGEAADRLRAALTSQSGLSDGGIR